MSVGFLGTSDWQGSRLAWLSGAWTAAGTILYLLWPALAPVLLPLCLVAPLLWAWNSDRPKRPFAISAVSAVLLVAAGYGFVNASWSMARQDAYAYVAMLIVAIVTLHFGLEAWGRVAHRPAVTAMTAGFYAGYLLAGCLLCHEILTDHRIIYHLIGLRAQAMPYPATLELPPSYLNHRMAALAILFWPAFFGGLHLSAVGWRRLILIAGLAPALVAIAASVNTTSKLAIVLGACTVLAARWSLAATRRLFMAAWGLACVGVVPLCLAAYEADVHHLAWLEPSARHRVVIWKATSDLVSKAPLLGVGIHSGRPITAGEIEHQLAPGTFFPLSVSSHSHNAFLQVWFETGAVGATILLGLGLVVLRAIGSLEVRAQSMLLASFASCTMISATGFSAFAPWLTASFAMCALFSALVLSKLRVDAEDGHHRL